MIQKVKGEAPFQVLASNFSIGPSNEGYTLQISADGVNYSNLFAVGANVTRMVTGVANGSYYRLSGNNSDVTVNWRTQCNDGGSGGGSSQYAESAGTANFADISNSTRLLDGIANFPQNANNGDVVAISQSTPTRGTRSLAPTLGVYQYDGSAWNKIAADSGSSVGAYKIELLSYDPQYFDERDIAALNAFYAALVADPSIGDGAYIKCGDYIFNLVEYSFFEGFGEFKFVMTNTDSINEVRLHFEDNEYSEGFLLVHSLYTYVIELSTPDPDVFDEGDINNINDFLSSVVSNEATDIYTSVIKVGEDIYRLIHFDEENGLLGFSKASQLGIQYIEINYADGEYLGGSYSAWVRDYIPPMTVLNSVSATPATVSQGDVFALTTPAQEGSWMKFEGSAGATLVRILTKSDGTYLFHFDNDNYFTGLDYTAGDPPTFSGSGWGLQQDDTYEWHYDNNGYYIRVWAEGEKDDWYIYAEMTQGDGGFSTLDAYGLGSDSEMFYGAEPAKVSVLQRYVTPAEDIVEVTYPDCSDEGGGRWQGRKVYVSVSGIPDEDYYLTQFESFDNFAELHIDGGRLYLHNSATDTDIFSIPLTGGMGSGLLGQVVIIGTYSQANERFQFQAYSDLAYNDQGAVVNGGIPSDLELAKKSDIPSPLPNPANKGGCALVSDNSGYTLTTNPVVQSYDTASSLGLVYNIVRIYQSDYNDLVSGGTVDSNTFYIILPDVNQ